MSIREEWREGPRVVPGQGVGVGVQGCALLFWGDGGMIDDKPACVPSVVLMTTAGTPSVLRLDKWRPDRCAD